MKECIKHTIECNCILPQFKNTIPTVFHKFVVFSIINEDGNLKPSYINCNNCGAIHKVLEVGQSIQTPKESISILPKIEEIKTQLPKQLVDILESYKCELHVWQELKFIFDEQKWGKTVLLTKETDGDFSVGKYVLVLGTNFFKVDSFSTEDEES